MADTVHYSGPLHSCTRLLSVLVALAVCCFVWAEDAGQNSTEESAPDNQQAADRNTLTINNYLDAIDRIEADEGGYSENLSDLYLGLGSAFLQKLEVDKAVDAFQKGLHVSKVNHGLFALQQTPYLESLSAAEARRNNWEGAIEIARHIYRIHEKNYGVNDPRMIPVLTRISDQHLANYKLRKSRDAINHLTLSEQTIINAAYISEAHFGYPSIEAENAYQKIAEVYYTIATHYQKYRGSSKSGVTFNTGGANQTYEEKTPQPSLLYYQAGKRALEKVIDSMDKRGQTGTAEHINATANLGDWYLAFGRSRSARKVYQIAYDLQQAAEDNVEISFDTPRPIQFEHKTADNQKSDGKLWVITSMSISSQGVPRNIEFADVPEGTNDTVLRKTQKSLMKVRFRPQLSDGQPVSTELFTMKYPLTI